MSPVPGGCVWVARCGTQMISSSAKHRPHLSAVLCEPTMPSHPRGCMYREKECVYLCSKEMGKIYVRGCCISSLWRHELCVLCLLGKWRWLKMKLISRFVNGNYMLLCLRIWEYLYLPFGKWINNLSSNYIPIQGQHHSFYILPPMTSAWIPYMAVIMLRVFYSSYRVWCLFYL